MYSFSALGSSGRVSCGFGPVPASGVFLFARGPVDPKQNLAAVPVLTGAFEEHSVLVAATDPRLAQRAFAGARAFAVSAAEAAELQRQMNLPLCVLRGEADVLYVKDHHALKKDAIASRIRKSKI